MGERACKHMSKHAYMQTQRQTHTHTYTHTQMYRPTHTHTHTHTFVQCMCTCRHRDRQIHTQTHTHTHTNPYQDKCREGGFPERFPAHGDASSLWWGSRCQLWLLDHWPQSCTPPCDRKEGKTIMVRLECCKCCSTFWHRTDGERHYRMQLTMKLKLIMVSGVCVCVCVCVWMEWTWSMQYVGIYTYQFIPYYASAVRKHMHTLKQFEDSEPMRLKVNIAPRL